MVVVRDCRASDITAYAAIQESVWDETMSAFEQKLESRFEVFPEGILVAEHEGVVVGCASFIRIDGYDEEIRPSWEDITDNGWCTTHSPNGRILFGVDLSVAKGAPRMTASQLFMAGMELEMSLGVDMGIWGGRMPRYHKYADKMTPDEYLVAKTKRGRYLDPEIELYSKIPGVEVVCVLPEYFKDWESLNCGVLLRFVNPIAQFPILRPFSRQIAGLFYAVSRRSRRRR